MTLQILLAAYNSEKYLAQQLDSILSQDYSDFQILLRDAGSTDRTIAIIRDYEKKYPGKVILTEQGKGNACQNFSRLLELSTADLVMFSDHDDVWMTDKISRTINKYHQAALEFGKNTPILVFTDSVVVNDKLDVIANSCFAHQNLDIDKLDFVRLVVQNRASGNTILLNRKLIKKTLPIPNGAVMHDHYLMLAASAMGKIVLLNEPTLFYRQHSKNVLGAVNYNCIYFLKLFFGGRKQIRDRFYRNIDQAAAFYSAHKQDIPQDIQYFLADLQNFPRLNFWKKRVFLMRHKMFKCGFIRNIGLFMLI